MIGTCMQFCHDNFQNNYDQNVMKIEYLIYDNLYFTDVSNYLY